MKEKIEKLETVSVVFSDSKCTKRIGKVVRNLAKSNASFAGIYHGRILPAGPRGSVKEAEADIADAAERAVWAREPMRIRVTNSL